MVTPLRWNLPAAAAAVVALVGLASPGPLAAQERQVHSLYDARMPPGAIGQTQVFQRGGPLSGYFQPVEIRCPCGAKIALAAEGKFQAPAEPVIAGFLIGGVYRLQVTQIPQHELEELYPTVEVIDRTYPPPGRAWQFPVVMELSEKELELALAGKYVTRVIYLEEPRRALANRNDPAAQEWFDVGNNDPLRVADNLGRPIAILRIGSRVPENPADPGMSFLFGCPPFKSPEVPKPANEKLLSAPEGVNRQTQFLEETLRPSP